MTDAKPAKKPAAPKKPAEHPKYIDMITTAIGALKERSGSSRQAIVKYVGANYKVGDTYESHLKQALKRGVVNGVITQAKGTGASGSFKLAKKPVEAKKPAAKKPAAKKSAAKKPAAKKPAAKKTTKKTTPKKSTTKKSTTKTSAKKPSTKKSPAKKKPAAKKAKKPAAKSKAKKPAKK